MCAQLLGDLLIQAEIIVCLGTNREMNKAAKLKVCFFFLGGGALESRKTITIMPKYIVGHSVFVTSCD